MTGIHFSARQKGIDKPESLTRIFVNCSGSGTAGVARECPLVKPWLVFPRYHRATTASGCTCALWPAEIVSELCTCGILVLLYRPTPSRPPLRKVFGVLARWLMCRPRTACTASRETIRVVIGHTPAHHHSRGWCGCLGTAIRRGANTQSTDIYYYASARAGGIRAQLLHSLCRAGVTGGQR